MADLKRGRLDPVWSRNQQILYRSGDEIMAVSYSVKGDSFVPEKPRVWISKLGAAQNGTVPMWDLAPDRKRVVIVAPSTPAEAPKAEHTVVFLQNFLDELRRRVPGK